MAGDHFVVYTLQSERNGRFYIGFSGDVASRLTRHNNRAVKATRYLDPGSSFTPSHSRTPRRRENESVPSRR